MRPLLSFGASVAVFTFVSAQALNVALAQSDGFTVLFDGKNLDAWRTAKGEPAKDKDEAASS